MTRTTGNHGRLGKKITAAGLVPLLLLAGLPPTAGGSGELQGLENTEVFRVRHGGRR